MTNKNDQIKENKFHINGILICVGILALLLFFTCNYEGVFKRSNPKLTTIKHSIDSTSKIVSKQKERARIDTVLIHITHIKYVDVYREVIKESPDTCHTYIDKLYAISNEQDSLFGNHILRQDSIINNQDSEILHYRFIVKSDSSYIMDSVPKLITKSKRKGFWNGFKCGFGAGVIITEAVNVGAKLTRS